VRRGVQTDLNRLGMATTLTAVVTDGERVVLGHVGDSRAYLLRDGALIQVSRDHTYVQDLVERGHLDEESVRRHPWRNVVLRSVDGDPVHEGLDLVPLDVEVGDRLLLCSDGLTDLVRDEAIADLLAVEDADAAAAACVEAALAAGGRDNVTCVVVDVVDGPSIVGDGQLLGAVREIGNIVDPAGLGRR
jgi:protein phosphatase